MHQACYYHCFVNALILFLTFSARETMKHVFAGLYFLVLCHALFAQKPVWQPTAGHTQVPIWPSAIPDPQPTSGPEFAETTPTEFPKGTGRSATAINNVTRPTMTVYSPKGNNTGVAVVVFPGGGVSKPSNRS